MLRCCSGCLRYRLGQHCFSVSVAKDMQMPSREDGIIDSDCEEEEEEEEAEEQYDDALGDHQKSRSSSGKPQSEKPSKALSSHRRKHPQSQMDKDGKTKTGFTGRMGNRIPAPRLLKLIPLDSHLAGNDNKFHGGHFSWVTENGKQERHVVATVGKFSVVWDFQQVKNTSHGC